MSEPSCLPFGQPLDIGQLLTRTPPALDFVLPGLTAGSVGALVGPGGMGKTMLELELAVLLASGLYWRYPLLGQEPQQAGAQAPQKVVLFAAEEPEPVLWHRLREFVGVLDQRNVLPEGMTWNDFKERLEANLVLYPLGGARRLNLLTPSLDASGDAQALMKVCEGARLAILDPLRQLHVEDENASAPMSALMSALKQTAQSSGAAVLVAHHSSRASGLQGYGDTADAGRGSTAIKDDARWQVNLVPAPRELLDEYGVPARVAADHVALFDAKNNYGPRRAPVLLRRTAAGVLVPVVPARRDAQTQTSPASKKRASSNRRRVHASV